MSSPLSSSCAFDWLTACISPLKDGLAWVRIGNCSKLTHNNPVGSHVPTVSFTAQVTTLVCDPTCDCDKKSVRIRIDIRKIPGQKSSRHPIWLHIQCEYHVPPIIIFFAHKPERMDLWGTAYCFLSWPSCGYICPFIQTRTLLSLGTTPCFLFCFVLFCFLVCLFVFWGGVAQLNITFFIHIILYSHINF